jgi:hypothetical protein
MMSKDTNYGSSYWAITSDREILYLMADRLEVLPCGALVAWGGYREEKVYTTTEPYVVYAIAAGQWHTYFAASMLNGGPVAGSA